MNVYNEKWSDFENYKHFEEILDSFKAFLKGEEDDIPQIFPANADEML